MMCEPVIFLCLVVAVVGVLAAGYGYYEGRIEEIKDELTGFERSWKREIRKENERRKHHIMESSQQTAREMEEAAASYILLQEQMLALVDELGLRESRLQSSPYMNELEIKAETEVG